MTVAKILSGGQTGVDRPALDFAIAKGIPHGGWCPKGRKAEDGPIDRRYRVEATPSGQYIQRTEWNVRDSNGTVIFARRDKLTAGSRKTAESARKQGKPFLHLAAQHGGANAAFLLQGLIQQNRIEVLKVAGSRLSGASEAEAVRPLDRDRDRAGAGADGTGVRRVPTRPR